MNMQQMKVSSKTHGIIDLCTSASMMILPRLLGCSKHCQRVLDAGAMLLLGQSLCTNYEFGLVKMIPFKGHLIIDAVTGAGLIGCAAANWQLDDDEKMLVAGFGAFEVGAAAMTQTQSGEEISEELYESIPDEVSMPSPREVIAAACERSSVTAAMYTPERELQSVGEGI